MCSPLSYVLQLFCSCNLWWMSCYCPCWMLCTLTLVLSKVCVQCPVWPFSVVPWDFMLSHYVAKVFSEWFWYGSFAPVIRSIISVFAFHMHSVSIVRSWYFRIFFTSLLITFLSPEIAPYINIYVCFSLSWVVMPSMFLRVVLSVCPCWFHKILPSWHVSTNSGTCLHQWCITLSYFWHRLHLLSVFCL